MNMFKLFYIFPLCIIIIFTSCDKVSYRESYTVKIPVFEKIATIRKKAGTITNPKQIEKSGKIYLYKDYLFINEPLKGIHIYDNADPSNPKSISFIDIPGNVDLAINDDVLYADSFSDLLILDISRPSNPVLLQRKDDVFKYQLVYNYQDKSADNVIVSYKDTVLQYDGAYTYTPEFPFVRKDKDNELVYNDANNYGTGGSMARFTLAKNHLYAVDQQNLHLFNVQDKKNPTYVKDITLGWGIETIFPYKENLFIGSNAGMYIFNIADPASPKQLSHYSHLRACDPVVVNDDYAFVTLRTGNLCVGNQNVLEVIDIKDLVNPKLVKSFAMKNPHGLTLSGDVLYLCEGNYGFKSFDATDVKIVGDKPIEYLADLPSTDVIPGPNSLVVIGENGICQYDYTDKSKLKKLSCITIKSI